jgi:hypothetical protein
MEGHNELFFNHKSMGEIVQHYLDTVLFRTPHNQEVVSINMNNPKSGFVVHLRDKEIKEGE